jgi:hypothetical protein
MSARHRGRARQMMPLGHQSHCSGALNRHVFSSDTSLPRCYSPRDEGTLVMSTSLVDECYRRAREARCSAEIASMPTQKTHFLELEQRWLRAAESVAPNIVRETKAATAQPKIISKVLKETLDVEPLRRAQEEDAAAPRSPDEIGDEQASSANLALTMQYRGLDQAIPLRLSSEDIGKLALEAQVREISLCQLVGMLIKVAMAEGLYRVLDDEPSGEPP